MSGIPSLGLMRLGSEAKQSLTTPEVKALILLRLIKHRDECSFTLTFILTVTSRNEINDQREVYPKTFSGILWHSLALKEEHNLRQERVERQPDIVITVLTGIRAEQSGVRIPVRAENVSLLQNVLTIRDSASLTFRQPHIQSASHSASLKFSQPHIQPASHSVSLTFSQPHIRSALHSASLKFSQPHNQSASLSTSLIFSQPHIQPASHSASLKFS